MAEGDPPEKNIRMKQHKYRLDQKNGQETGRAKKNGKYSRTPHKADEAKRQRQSAVVFRVMRNYLYRFSAHPSLQPFCFSSPQKKKQKLKPSGRISFFQNEMNETLNYQVNLPLGNVTVLMKMACEYPAQIVVHSTL